MNRIYALVVLVLLAACHRPQSVSHYAPPAGSTGSVALVSPQEELPPANESTAQNTVAAAGTSEEMGLPESVASLPPAAPLPESSGNRPYLHQHAPAERTVQDENTRVTPAGKVTAFTKARRELRQLQDAPTGGKTNTLGVISFVLGLVAIPLLFVPSIGGLLGVLSGIAAIITGAIAKGKIKRSGGTQKGKGWATAGLILGIVDTALFILLVLAVAAYLSSGQ